MPLPARDDQQVRRGPRLRVGRVALAAMTLGAAAAGGPALAQDAAQAPASTVTPSIGFEGAHIDTRDRVNDYNGGEFATRVSPGVRWTSRGGAVRGVVDYTANLIHRSRPQDVESEVQNALNASLLAEPVSNFAYIEATASISQQAISAFGQQSVQGDLLHNSNHTEVRDLMVTPYVRGQLGGWADYEVRANAGTTDSRDPSAPDSTITGGSAVLRWQGRHTVLDWSLGASNERVNYDNGQFNENNRLQATASATPVPDLTLTLIGGREWVHNGALDRQNVNNYGAGLHWTPSERTNLEIEGQERYFGPSQRVVFEHRMARSVFKYSLTRDATTSSDATGVGQPKTLYQTLYDEAASAQPDPALRDQAVLDLLRQLGLDPNQVVSGGFLTSAVTVQRRQDLSLAFLGLRDTFTLQAMALDSKEVQTTAALAEVISQFGYTATLSHRLTPTASVNLEGSRLKTFDTPTQPGSDLKSASIYLLNQISRRTSTSLSARYSVFSSTVDPYRETSVTASINLQF